jgi:hypothetical protein
MKTTATVLALATSAVLYACGGGAEPPKTAPAAAPKAEAPKAEAPKEEKKDAAESHGMPGMSDLFKVEEKKPEEKKAEPTK